MQTAATPRRIRGLGFDAAPFIRLFTAFHPFISALTATETKSARARPPVQPGPSSRTPARSRAPGDTGRPPSALSWPSGSSNQRTAEEDAYEAPPLAESRLGRTSQRVQGCGRASGTCRRPCEAAPPCPSRRGADAPAVGLARCGHARGWPPPRLLTAAATSDPEPRHGAKPGGPGCCGPAREHVNNSL